MHILIDNKAQKVVSADGHISDNSSISIAYCNAEGTFKEYFEGEYVIYETEIGTVSEPARKLMGDDTYCIHMEVHHLGETSGIWLLGSRSEFQKFVKNHFHQLTELIDYIGDASCYLCNDELSKLAVLLMVASGEDTSNCFGLKKMGISA